MARFNRSKCGHGLDAGPDWPHPRFQTRPYCPTLGSSVRPTPVIDTDGVLSSSSSAWPPPAISWAVKHSSQHLLLERRRRGSTRAGDCSSGEDTCGSFHGQRPSFCSGVLEGLRCAGTSQRSPSIFSSPLDRKGLGTVHVLLLVRGPWTYRKNGSVNHMDIRSTTTPVSVIGDFDFKLRLVPSPKDVKSRDLRCSNFKSVHNTVLY